MWKSGNSDRFYFLGLQNHCRNEKMLAPWKKSSDQPRQHIKKWIHHFTDKDPYSQNYGFYSSHVGIWELDHKEGWALKNLCFSTVVLEKTLETWDPWTTRRSNQSILKEISPEYSLEGEATILWLSDAKSQLIGKDPDATKDWGQEEKGSTEDEMVGWHHRLKTRVWANSGTQWRTRKPGVLVHEVAKNHTWLTDWTREHSSIYKV